MPAVGCSQASGMWPTPGLLRALPCCCLPLQAPWLPYRTVNSLKVASEFHFPRLLWQNLARVRRPGASLNIPVLSIPSCKRWPRSWSLAGTGPPSNSQGFSRKHSFKPLSPGKQDSPSLADIVTGDWGRLQGRAGVQL